MTIRSFGRPRLTRSKFLFCVFVVGALGAAVSWGRYAFLPKVEAAGPGETALPAPLENVPPTAPPLATSAVSSDYSQRVVAYIHGTMSITREQLGEYLIARCGAEKVPHLVNKIIIERGCAAKGIGATDAEIDALLADDLASYKVNKREFLDRILQHYHKSLYEWREDVLRPKILMTKLLQAQVRVDEEDIRKAFESLYGERLRCQAVMWPLDQQEKARQQYDTLVKSTDEFDRAARSQANRRLAAVGGMLEPFGRYGLGDEDMEKTVFSLREGEITPLMKMTTPEGQFCAVVKLIQRLTPEKVVKLEEVRSHLEKEILDKKVQALIPAECEKMRADADPRIVFKAPESEIAKTPAGTSRAREPVAYIYRNTPIAREELGEYLIARYGPDRIDLLVNKLIIEKACADKGIAVGEQEVEEALAKHLEALKLDRKEFVEKVLRQQRKTLYEVKEDALRPQLLMKKLVANSVRVEEEDLRKGFEAYFGEKVECLLILWPRTPRDREIAIKQYELIRKSKDEFDRAARTQASARLAANGGKIEAFGRFSTGNEAVEREVFKLRPGEITPLIETPEGYAVFKLERRLPADTNVKLEDKRASLEKEIIEKKIILQIPTEFQKLREVAAPNVLMRPAVREEELTRQVKKELEETKVFSKENKIPSR